MLAGWKALDTQTNSLTINLSEEDLDRQLLKRQLDGYNHKAGTRHLLG